MEKMWGTIEKPASRSDKKGSILSRIKPNFLKRREALQNVKGRGFESLDDFKVKEIEIERIIKDNNEKEFTSENIFGKIIIDNPLLGDKPTELLWKVKVGYMISFGEHKIGNISFAWGEKEHEISDIDEGTSMYNKAEKRGKQFGLDKKTYHYVGIPEYTTYSTQLDVYYRNLLDKVKENVTSFIGEYVLPEKSIDEKFRNLSFQIKTEISTKTEEELQKELADSLGKGTVDGKFIYTMGGAEKFLELIQAENYEIANTEKEIIHANLDELGIETGDTIFDLGCGDGSKAKPILEKTLTNNKKVKYCPVDISPRMIFEAANNTPEGIETEGLLFDFSKDFKDKIPSDKKATLAIFGSTLGNGNLNYQEKLIKNFGNAMKEGDNAIIGLQLNYDFQEILRKYQDPRAASFAEPMLEKLGIGEEDAEIFISGDEIEKKISLNVKILKDKKIKIGENNVDLPKGKVINLIVSHKYEIPEMEHLAEVSGLKIKKSFLNSESSYGLFVLEK